jgi:hypothetical protein
MKRCGRVEEDIAGPRERSRGFLQERLSVVRLLVFVA